MVAEWLPAMVAQCAALSLRWTPPEREERKGPEMIKPKLHHVTLKTSRLDEMIAWYGAVIGAKVQFRDQTAAWTTNDEANHRIAFLAVPGLSDDREKPRHNGMHHCVNFVELQSDIFGDWAKSSEFMRTSADFAANPIGTFFDPARVYDEMKAGAEFKTLQQSIRAGAFQPQRLRHRPAAAVSARRQRAAAGAEKPLNRV
jgi:catechol 2,3-dioxygenase